MILIWAFLACRGDTQQEGTIVGNPGDAKTKIASGSDLEFFIGNGTFLEIVLGSGEELWESFEFEDVDLLDPQQIIEIPSGKWDSMSIYLGELYLEGYNSYDARSFSIFLEDIAIELDGQESFNIAEQDYILELARPDWLTGEYLEQVAFDNGDTGLSILIDDETPEYNDIFGSVEKQTGFFNDLDGDGEIDSQEREDGNVAYTTSTAEEKSVNDQPEDDTGASSSETISTCGCSDTTMSILLFPLLGLGVLLRREE